MLTCDIVPIDYKNNVKHSLYVTRPVKIGHICTQILHDFLKFNLMLLHTYFSYLHETFRTYSKIHKELFKIFRACLSYPEPKKQTFV